MKHTQIKKVVIPAAGFGTRFLPITKAVAKEMIPIVDKPTIQYIIEEAKASGITDIIIITSGSKKIIEDHFDRSWELENLLISKNKQGELDLITDVSNMVNIAFVRQKEAKGLGHAILQAKPFINDEPFAIMLGDDIVVNEAKPCLKQLIDVYNQEQASVVGVQTVAKDQVDKYGIVDPGTYQSENGKFQVAKLVEKPRIESAPSQLAILGRYILTPGIFAELEIQEPGAGGEIQLTDAIQKLVEKEKVFAYDFEGTRYDIGDKIGFLKATVDFALEREDLKNEFLEYLKTKVK
jgi:UTP--glucose-1-phosphate uridylyltransferase